MFYELGDEAGLARANEAIASHHLIIGGETAVAAAIIRGVREVLSAHGYKRSLCAAMATLGNIASYEQSFAVAIEAFSLAGELAVELEDPRFEHLALLNMSVLEFSRGDVERAIELGRKAVASARDVRQRYFLPRALHNMAAYLLSADRLGDARPFAEEALSRLQGEEPSLNLRMCLQMWALIAALEEAFPQSARLIAWVDAAYGQSGSTRNRWEQRSYERLLALLRSHLAQGEIEALAAEGTRWGPGQAVNFTFERIVRAASRAFGERRASAPKRTR